MTPDQQAAEALHALHNAVIRSMDDAGEDYTDTPLYLARMAAAKAALRARLDA